MDHLADQFVSRRQELGLFGPGRRIPEDLRLLAVRFARRVIEAGGTPSEAARHLGVLAQTLERWLDAAAPSEPTLREVVLRDDGPSAHEVTERALIVTTPDGFRIEGVAASELPALIRVLR